MIARFIQILAAITGASLLLMLGLPLEKTRDASEAAVRQPTERAAPATATTVASAAEMDVDGLLTRPLFVEGRRPMDAKALPGRTIQAAEAQTASSGKLPQLLGVLAADGRYLAYFSIDEQKGFRVGDLINGWRVKSIDKNSVSLERGGRSVRLQLRAAQKQKIAKNRGPGPLGGLNDDEDNE